MKIGIVGNAEDKFTPKTRRWARRAIRSIIREHKTSLVISGGCHLGGVDEWAEEIAEKLCVSTRIHLPKKLQWEPNGYKDRNLRIAIDADFVVCIVAGQYPKKYDGERFVNSTTGTLTCYHCELRRPPHVKSGGCWTAMQCGLSEWRIIYPDGWQAVPLRGFFTRSGSVVPA